MPSLAFIFSEGVANLILPEALISPTCMITFRTASWTAWPILRCADLSSAQASFLDKPDTSSG